MGGTNSTLPLRIATAMEQAGLSQPELVTQCEKLLAPNQLDKTAFYQVINPQTTIQYSPYLSLIAEATGVRAVWLQWGIGEILAPKSKTHLQ